MPRRTQAHSDLPDNLYTAKVKGTTYYQYKLPDGSKKSVGKDKATAISRAKLLNQHFADQQNDNVLGRLMRTSGYRILVTEAIDQFWSERVPDFGWAKRTAGERQIKTNKYKLLWDGLYVDQLSTRFVSEFLDLQTRSAYIQHRVLLKLLMDYWVAKGYLAENYAAKTLTKKPEPRKRQRHTEEGFWKIYDAAPDFLQRAMLIALYSLQRESDVVKMHVKHLDKKAKTLKVLQGKTENYKEPVFIEIECGDDLWGAIERCLRSPIHCPYLIHKRFSGRVQGNKPHQFALTADYLSRAFSDARDKSEAYAHLEKRERPAFHDIRALGIHLYKKAGFDGDYVNALSGHATDAMREHYEEGHEAVAPKLVKAGLKLRKKV